MSTAPIPLKTPGPRGRRFKPAPPSDEPARPRTRKELRALREAQHPRASMHAAHTGNQDALGDVFSPVLPLSRERMCAILQAQNLSPVTKGDEVVCKIGKYWFAFNFYRQDLSMLQIRGILPTNGKEADFDLTVELCHDWNRDNIWPKAYVTITRGACWVFAEHTIDFSEGATDGQILHALELMLIASLRFFHWSQANTSWYHGILDQ